MSNPSFDPQDTFTETSTRGWGSRIAGSIKGVLVGLVLIVASIVGLFWNEGRAVQTARSLTEGAGLVVAVPADRVDTAHEGRLVHVTGDATAVAPLVDPDFGVTARALRLQRKVEMYQWKEESRTETRKNFGGSEETVTTYSYTRVWAEGRIDSGRFRRPEGHTNPALRYQSRDTVAADATLGAFRPGEAVLRRLSADRPLPVDRALAPSIRKSAGQSATVTGDAILIGADPDNPRVGDLRITYRTAEPGPVSVVARQTGSAFSAYQTKAGDAVMLVRAGTASAEEMFSAAQTENTIMTWILRAVLAFMMFAGFGLLLKPFVVLADVVPFLGNVLQAGAGLIAGILTLTVAPLVIAIAWLWYRPLVSLTVIVVGGGLTLVLVRMARRRRQAKSAPATAYNVIASN
jgi:hypothetical protein